jgi:26S proteasome regulatory subunit N5
MSEWKSASWKQEEDHSSEADAVLARVNAETVPVLLLSSSEPLDKYLGELLAVEKKARFGGDAISTQRTAVEVVKILRTLGKNDDMMAQVEILMKKRGQMKQVQSAMLNEAAIALDSADISRDDKMKLLNQLKFQAEGKLHVELEHARYSMRLASMLVDAQPGQSTETVSGNKRLASDMLHAVQVETITNMPRLEKIESVLMQLKLSLELQDPSRTQMLSRKINPRAIGKADTREHKVRYFKLLSQHFEREKQYLVMARCWHEIYLTIPSVDDMPKKPADDDDANKVAFDGTTRAEALSNCIVLVLLAGHATAKEIEDAAECAAFSKQSQQTDRTEWLKELAASRDVETELPSLHRVLEQFVDVELLRSSLVGPIDQLAAEHPVLRGHADRREALRERLSEHDVIVASRYYKRIRLERLSELVGLSVEATESFIMKLVGSSSIYAKIDRIDGVVVFERQAKPIDVVEKWNTRVERIATLVDRSCHLIAKERMLIAVAANAASSAAAAAAVTA